MQDIARKLEMFSSTRKGAGDYIPQPLIDNIAQTLCSKGHRHKCMPSHSLTLAVLITLSRIENGNPYSCCSLCSYSNIVDIVHCGKQTVGRYQKWFRELPYERARSLVPNDRIKRFVKGDFPEIACFNKDKLAMALERRITTDSVLLYYGHSTAPKETPESPQRPLTTAQSMNLDLLGRHWDRLRELTVTFRERSKAPTPETIFTADVCHSIYTSVIFKTPLVPSAHWGRLFEASFMIRQLSQGPIPLRVKLFVEGESLFSQLIEHLRSDDSRFFPVGFTVWKVLYDSIVSLSLKIIKKVTIECPRVILAGYASTDREYGLHWELPAYLCRYLLAQYAGKPIPRITPLCSYDGREPVKLVPLDQFVGLTLVQEAGYDCIERYLKALAELVKRIYQEDDKILSSLNKTFSEIATVSSELRKVLIRVIERGDYQGVVTSASASSKSYLPRLTGSPVE